jgi:hypothetical protein
MCPNVSSAGIPSKSQGKTGRVCSRLQLTALQMPVSSMNTIQKGSNNHDASIDDAIWWRYDIGKEIPV